MKVLVATGRTQGARTNDYNWCVEGELVALLPPCATDEADPGGGCGCGCGRGFAGLSSHRSTTTSRVAELGLSRDEYVEALRYGLEEQGYRSTDIEATADELLDVVSDLPAGTVLQRRLWDLEVRELPAPGIEEPGRMAPDE